MKSFIAAASLLALAFANPVIVEKEIIDASAYSYAIDLTIAATVSQYSCLKSAGYSAAFVSAYSSIGSGLFDSNSIVNINNAQTAGLGTEVYMRPVSGSTKNGTTQFNEVYSGLTNQGINVRFIWIQVTSPIHWDISTSANTFLINSVRSAAKAKGVSVGIYSNFYDWKQITGPNYNTPAASGELLWYWNVNGGGPLSQTTPDFTDFRSFGGWSLPMAKQYDQLEYVCGIRSNRDVYLTGAFTSAMARRESEGPVVGNFIH